MFTFIESSIFERVLPAYLDDVRWARPGSGKRSGLRIIYYVRYRPNEFWMLTLYAKAKRENVPAHVLKQLLEVFRDG